MRNVIFFLRDNKRKMLLLFWIVLSVVYAFFRDMQDFGFMKCGVFVLGLYIITIVSGALMAYLVMKSWKFGIVFPIVFLAMRKGEESFLTVGEYLFFLVCILGMFLSLILLYQRKTLGNLLCLFYIVIDILLIGVNTQHITSVLWQGIEDIIDDTNKVIMILSCMFCLCTLIKKRRNVLILLRKFKRYVIVFLSWYVFALCICELLYNSLFRFSPIIAQVFLIFCMYVFLTMWWHPGYYYNEVREGSHRFDVFADDYREIHTRNVNKLSGENSDYFTLYKLREIEQYLDNCEAFLDFGCGDGNTARFFSDMYKHVKYVGIDVSEKSIEKANKMNLPGCSFISYDGKQIPYKDESFDIVFMACVLHHINTEDREYLLKECLRVLKQGGKLIIFEHNPWNIVTCNTVDQCAFDEDAILLSPLESWTKTIQVGFARAMLYFTLFIPRKGLFKRMIALENYLKWCPIGAQYYVIAEKGFYDFGVNRD